MVSTGPVSNILKSLRRAGGVQEQAQDKPVADQPPRKHGLADAVCYGKSPFPDYEDNPTSPRQHKRGYDAGAVPRVLNTCLLQGKDKQDGGYQRGERSKVVYPSPRLLRDEGVEESGRTWVREAEGDGDADEQNGYRASRAA
jgi:hypothetical protein